MKKLLLTLSMLLGVNTSTVMAELTQTELHATLSIVTNFILGDSIVHNGTTYGTVTSPFTGKVWLDRNLGAHRVCTSFDDIQCYGDYYQWGRNFDGHQDSGSDITDTLATNVNDAGTRFIIHSLNWASVDINGSLREANWSKTDGSSVCPVGFRVSTMVELSAELLDPGSAEIQNRDNAFASFLKIPSAGQRDILGSMRGVGIRGNLWTKSVDNVKSHRLFFNSSLVKKIFDARAFGFSVRCIRSLTQ